MEHILQAIRKETINKNNHNMANREWKTIEGFDFKEILFEEYNHIAKITITLSKCLHTANGLGDFAGVFVLS